MKERGQGCKLRLMTRGWTGKISVRLDGAGLRKVGGVYEW